MTKKIKCPMCDRSMDGEEAVEMIVSDENVCDICSQLKRIAYQLDEANKKMDLIITRLNDQERRRYDMG